MRFICSEGCVVEGTKKNPPPRICETHNSAFVYEKDLRRTAQLKKGGDLRRARPLKQGRGFAVVKAQRDKVGNLPCVYCGVEGTEYNPIDPAHLVPRHWVKCEHPEGVIPLCRKHHREYDVPSGGLDILAQLEERGYHVEMGHFIAVHQLNPLTLLRYVTGMEYVPAERQAA